MLAGDERAHLVASVCGRADLNVGDARFHFFDECVGHRVDGEHNADRHAPLARRAVRGADRSVGGHVEIGIGQHEHVVLGATECLHALAIRCTGLVDVLRDWG